jgi:pyruvate dehydrogenase E2 component (dihydrolipoamide acetyltransferase)
MPTEVIMPRLGWDMKVGSVAEWLKRDGDRVEAGQPIRMIAGDKATTELEAPDSGILRIPSASPEPGEEVPVGTLLAYLVAVGEDVSTVADEGRRRSVSDSPPTLDLGSAPIDVAARTGADVAQRRDRERRIVASPRARRAAAAIGLDWHALVGSGRGGRILERDVHAAKQAGAAAIRPDGGAQAVPLHGIRRLTAERMTLSAQTVAAVTLTTEADATYLVRLREQTLAERAAHSTDSGDDADPVPTYTDFMIKIVALGLAEHPALNASLTEAGIVLHTGMHVAIAVDTPRGLVAPVVHDAGARPVASIARESARVLSDARDGASRPADLAGATFTITNLGMFEIDAFTPMVNLPQCAILGLGRIVARPVVVDEAAEQVAVRRMLSLSLTFDHRLVDGAPAARFLQRVKHLVERPTLWLFR